MMLDPFQRFLGVDEEADAAALLGLDNGPVDAARIEEALRLRLAKVYMHPDGRSPDAEQVRSALRTAAAELKGARVRVPSSAPRHPSSLHSRRMGVPRPRSAAMLMNLTAFDRMALAVLVGCGGWNAASRARLVALAASYGIAPQGLMHVLRGLADYARNGGPRLDAQQMTGWTPALLSSPAAARATFGHRPIPSPAVAALTEAAERDLWWTKYRLLVVYSVIGIILATVLMRIIMGPSVSQTPSARLPSTNLAAPAASTATSQLASSSQAEAGSSSRLARFTKFPTFLGNGLPFEAVSAVDQCSLVAVEIDQLARRISIADEPSPAIFRHWDELIQTIASAWPLADISTRNAVERAIFEALRAAVDRPATGDRLLAALTPAQTVLAPIEIWRGAWAAGTLGRLGTSTDLPPVIVERARSQLQVALNNESKLPMSFEAAAGAWLDLVRLQLVEGMELDERTYDYWELWLTAQRKLGRGPGFDAAVMRALTDVLATQTDLYRPGPTLNIAARLLATVLESPSQQVRDQMIALFDDERVAARDLWVITSLMALSDNSTWFDETLVVPQDADQRHRWRLRDALAKAWPVDDETRGHQAQRLAMFDAAAGERWGGIADRILNLPSPRSPETALQYLVLASQAHEAAEAMLLQRYEYADDRMTELEIELGQGSEAGAGLRRTPPLTSARAVAPRPGQVLGRDGEWAAGYELIGRNAEQRLQSIAALRGAAGTDLGPMDAEVFVREAYRATPFEVRAAAQALLVDRFAAGPNVALEVLDQFAAIGSDTSSELIQSYTGVILPDPRSEDWLLQARLALVEHVLKLQPVSTMELDTLAEWLTETCARRIILLMGQAASPTSPQNPQDAAAILEGIWSDRAAVLVTSRPVPDTHANLRRRHNLRVRLANGPIQTFVAHQATTLEWLAYVVVAEVPAQREQVLTNLQESSSARSRNASVVEQALEIERAGLRIWRLRMGLGVAARQGEETR